MDVLRQQLADLEAEFQAATGELGARGDALAEPLETLSVRPTRQNVTVKLVTLARTPAWQDRGGQTTPAWR